MAEIEPKPCLKCGATKFMLVVLNDENHLMCARCKAVHKLTEEQKCPQRLNQFTRMANGEKYG